MVELEGVRHIWINGLSRVGQHSLRMNPCGIQHGFQQRGFVFAVAIAIDENFTGGVGLVASHAEGEADVPDILGNPVIQGLGFGVVGVEAMHDFVGFRANFGSGEAAILFEIGVPIGDLRPTLKGRK